MIPIQLTLEGIYSYQEKQTIDFRTLTDNHIFGIFGGVGSGKSTILEAITFALYGETERLNSRENRNYNMMNLKSNQLFIEFIFSAGKENTQYKFNVSGKRNKNKYEDVRNLKRAAYISENGTWIPLQSSKADDILGLSYENFRRTIIIPQGKFQEFLQLGEAPRTKMLQEIFKLERFDLTDKVKALYSRVEKDIEHNKGRLVQLESFTEEKQNEFIQELSNAKSKLESAETENALAIKKLKSYEELEKQNLRLLAIKKDLETHKAEESKIDLIEKNLKEYLDCKELFENDLHNQDNLLKNKEKLETEIATAKPKFEKIISDLDQQKERFSIVEKESEKRPDYLKQADDLSKISQIKDLNLAIESHTTNLEKSKFDLNKLSSEIDSNKEDLNAKINTHEGLSSQKEYLFVLKEIENWHKIKIQLTRERKNYSQKLENTIAKAKFQQKRLDTVYADFHFLHGIDKHDIGNLIKKVEEKVEELESLKDKEKTKMLEFDARTEIRKELNNLKDGDPCPVCGSTTHPAKKEYEIGTELVAESTKILEQLEAQIKIIFQQKKVLTEISLILDNIDSDKESLQDEIERVSSEINSLTSDYKWDPKYLDDKVLLTDDIKSTEDSTKIYDKLTSEIKQIRETIEGLSHKSDDLKSSINKIEIEKEKYAAQKQTIESTLQFNFYAKYREYDKAQIEAEAASINKKVQENDTLHIRLAENIQNLEQKRTELSTTISLKEDSICGLESEIQSLHEKINSNLSGASFGSIDNVRQILSQNLDRNKIQDRIDRFRSELSKLKNELSIVETEIAGKKYNKEEHSNLKSKELQIKAQIKELNEKIGSLQSAIEEIKAKLSLKAEILELYKKLEIRKENIQLLSRLFHSKGFVNFISRVYLQQLCAIANKRFSLLTNRQLELLLSETNNFEVRDHMNGGKIRSVKTLSGGQTFQASLSLALSLAENVQSQVESNQNFFFLDEGFGSLDKDSLHIVFDTLKSLRKENRIVGLISHVEELQEEIDVFLKLKNDADSGTTISKSWKD